MHVSFTTEENDFQKEVNSFFNEKYPADIKEKQNKSVPLEKEDFIRWQKTLYEQGWAAPNWPVEYGGTGWTPVQKYIFANENAKANAPAIVPFGLGMVGPVIYTYGNEAQKKKFLPGILASDVWWCQGYSEPGSGSDLASLKMKAERVGNEYVLNGTKTWTTLGHMADWIFCLVRTSSDVARRQEGISFILVDMATEGVSVKPIITIEGDREVNEVHFENVKVPAENLIGEEGKGWTYGKVLLQHERTSIAGVARSQYRLSRLKEKIRNSDNTQPSLTGDNDFLKKIGQLEIELKALEFTELRTLAAVSVGKAPGPESSLLKIRGTEIQQKLDELFMEAAGYFSLPYVPQQYNLNSDPEEHVGFGADSVSSLVYFNNRKASIYGGSNEIQKNIIAKHVLGL
jgi:alkylation response protein AidB-like acyl-CoA dehydrogenase|tara:strand:+ start:1300 stop:2502 length:1203 start_codon:yes stop_codon:yes gene_type:complete